MDLRDYLEYIVDNYDMGDGTSTSAQRYLRDAATSLKEYITGHDKLCSTSQSYRMRIRGSGGMGRAAEIPWVGIRDLSETSSFENGLYIVYLFSSDMSSFFITLAQGITRLTNDWGAVPARSRMRTIAQDIRSSLPTDLIRGLDDCVVLGARTARGKGYQDSVILAKRYVTGSLPAEDEFREDLAKFLKIYGIAIDVKNGKPSSSNRLGERSANAQAKQEYSMEKLAQELLIDVSSLENLRALLRDRKQVILYGPPGTGKTFIAEKFASVFAGELDSQASRVQTVQFHPTYSYEDLVEGYSPARGNGGETAFELQDGPLKKIAAAASSYLYETQPMDNPEKTYVLIIDEINRVDLSEVLGELLSLLEHRDKSIQLRYSKEQFQLLPNLYIIGTMSTAGHPIKRLDAALRRRFHFYPLFPDRPPIKNLLARWVAKHHPTLDWIAKVVDRANELLNDPNAAIGPSHFLREDLDEEKINLIWNYTILPYIEDYYLGESEYLEGFSLTGLRADAVAVSPQRPGSPENSP